MQHGANSVDSIEHMFLCPTKTRSILILPLQNDISVTSMLITFSRNNNILSHLKSKFGQRDSDVEMITAVDDFLNLFQLLELFQSLILLFCFYFLNVGAVFDSGSVILASLRLYFSGEQMAKTEKL